MDTAKLELVFIARDMTFENYLRTKQSSSSSPPYRSSRPQNCNIYARKPMANQRTPSAQNRKDPNQNTGISIHACKIVATSDLRRQGEASLHI
ncbi:hypothetical protein HAX54_049732 [Datura stramonium]|uniref:Pectinesterase catalytic domain-containing protein n=1 Tax=Datura stramonium TaxID=4076 RepID=A0ABS8WMR8_DATST|nr:hypothetical protein [Datura stramonium]